MFFLNYSSLPLAGVSLFCPLAGNRHVCVEGIFVCQTSRARVTRVAHYDYGMRQHGAVRPNHTKSRFLLSLLTADGPFDRCTTNPLYASLAYARSVGARGPANSRQPGIRTPTQRSIVSRARSTLCNRTIVREKLPSFF